MRPPKLIKPYVRRFCQRVEPRSSGPIYIPSQPLPQAEERDCFITVAEQVARKGGEQVIGWAVWEWPRVLLEAEFHAAWRTPEGELLNITPYPYPLKRMLFLPSPHRRFEGRQVNNVREALDRDPLIQRLIQLHNLYFAEINRGELAEQFGEIEVGPEAVRCQTEIRNTLWRLQERYGASEPE